MHPRIGRRLVLFPLPLQGHLNPMFQLANILHSKGFSISIIHTEFNAPNTANHSNFSFHPIADGFLESDRNDGVGGLPALNIKCVAPFRDCLLKLSSDASEEPIACLITDAIWHFTQAVADSLKLPRLVLRTSNICSFVAFDALPLLREKGYLPIQDSQLEEPVLELPPLRIKDIPQIGSCYPEAFFQLISSACKEVRASKGLIFNSFEELEDSALAKVQKDFGIPVFPIGPFHKLVLASSSSLWNADRSCISWLNTKADKSVLYVSFGSIVAIDESKFLDITWALANSKQPFLWVVRPGMVHGSKGTHQLPDELIDIFGDNGHIVSWAPQQEVLAHPAIGGFWTHCGWNSIFESICEGVPMICLPCFGDQTVNARYITDVWKVGLHLGKNPIRGEIEMVIKTLMGEKGQEMRDKIAHLREKASLCLLEGGSSYNLLESLVSYVLSL